MENRIAQYPTCPVCKVKMVPIWFLEKEYNSYHKETGRVRESVDYFSCPLCLRTEISDDTFSGG